MTMPHMSIRKLSHTDGRRRFRITLLAGCPTPRIQPNGGMYCRGIYMLHLEDRVREEEHGEREEVLRVRDVQVRLEAVQPRVPDAAPVEAGADQHTPAHTRGRARRTS
jgi:hypothetical protein